MIETMFKTNQEIGAIAKIFSRSIIDDLIRFGSSKHLIERLAFAGINHQNVSSDLTMGHLFDAIYQTLVKSYRSEYVYKNAIAQKIFLSRHSLTSSRLFAEFRVSNCKADAVILNGTSSAYEIKTEYDNLLRLPDQIVAYLSAFDHVWVVTTASIADSVLNSVPKSVGIIILTEKYTFRTIRPSVSNIASVCPSVIFDTLRKDEYISIVEEYFGPIPAIPNTQIYKFCRERFCALTPEVCHNKMVEMLKHRRNYDTIDSAFSLLPNSMKGLLLMSTDIPSVDIGSLIDALSEKAKVVLKHS